MLQVLGRREAGAGKMLAVSDGEFHARLGRAIAELLAGARSQTFAVGVSAAARTLADAIDGGRPTLDAVHAFAAEVSGRILGIPATAWREAHDLALAAVVDEPDLTSPSTAQMRMIQLMRGETVGDPVVRGVLAGLRDVIVHGRNLRRDEVLLNSYGLLLGAAVTTGTVLARIVLLAATSPETWCAWRRAGPTRESIEEAVRWATPAAHFMRTASIDVDVDGVRIQAGDAVTVWLGAANRDAQAFDAADELRLDRAPNRHLAFGSGAHYCTGAPVARMALTAALAELLQRFAGFKLADHSWLRSNFISGLRTLQVEPVVA
ncbi:MAG: cytochrome P450 [Acidimicrobiia bacterium]